MVGNLISSRKYTFPTYSIRRRHVARLQHEQSTNVTSIFSVHGFLHGLKRMLEDCYKTGERGDWRNGNHKHQNPKWCKGEFRHWLEKYSDIIRNLHKQMNSMPDGAEKDKIKDIIVKAKLESNADSKPTAKQG
jgi:hypothetical protein